MSSLLLPGLPWDAFFTVFDAPLPALAVPGFVGGTLFSLVLGVAGRRRRFEQLSLPRVAAWGALGGVLLSLLPAALVGAGLATVSAEGAGVWTLTGLIVGPLVLLSTLSATGSLLVARRAARHDQLTLDGDGNPSAPDATTRRGRDPQLGDASLSPTIPATMSPTLSSRAALADSPNSTMPSSTVPTAPTPTHTL